MSCDYYIRHFEKVNSLPRKDLVYNHSAGSEWFSSARGVFVVYTIRYSKFLSPFFAIKVRGAILLNGYPPFRVGSTKTVCLQGIASPTISQIVQSRGSWLNQKNPGGCEPSSPVGYRPRAWLGTHNKRKATFLTTFCVRPKWFPIS